MDTRPFPRYREFEWREGYGASASALSQVKRTIAYIENQKEHHRKRTFQEEFLELLDKHCVDYDLRYVFC